MSDLILVVGSVAFVVGGIAIFAAVVTAVDLVISRGLRK